MGGGEGGTDCDAAESVFQIKKLNKRPQGQSWTPRKEVVNVESRTGCNTLLSSPGKVGYFRTLTHTEQKYANTQRPLPPLSTPSYSVSPWRGCCQPALQELRSTSWLLSGGDAISAGLLIQLVIFGFLFLFGWVKAHCLAQMSCPWQISQKPGSLPCLLWSNGNGQDLGVHSWILTLVYLIWEYFTYLTSVEHPTVCLITPGSGNMSTTNLVPAPKELSCRKKILDLRLQYPSRDQLPCSSHSWMFENLHQLMRLSTQCPRDPGPSPIFSTD